MFTSFYTALSGLNANATAVDVIGNNLANLNTAGYKNSVVSFYDLMTQSMGGGSVSNQIGAGVGNAQTARQFTQGTLQTTNGPLDAAIQGNGFFLVHDAAGKTLYTRAGNFQMDINGKLLTSTGQAVQGWTAANGTLATTGATGDMVLPLGAVRPAAATGTVSMNANLDATTAVDGTFSVPVQVIDSLGSKHVLTVTYTKTGPNAWKYDVSMPGNEVTAGKAGTPFPIPGAAGTLTFDDQGNLKTPAATTAPVSIKIAGLASGAADLNINWSLYDSTGVSQLSQYGQASAFAGTTQDGTAAGQITGLSLADGGKIVAHYSNGDDQTLGQIALATIRNPQSLIAVGENNLAAGPDTADAAIGASGTGANGKIIGGSLEASTVDIATQFTSLIVMQRSYQANSKVITATDELSQETINLIR